MDPSQIDQILANLCVNARDATSDTGKVTVRTSYMIIDKTCQALQPDFQPGRYILLSVSDSGCGLDRETQMQLFEPFFATKEMGKGTGLGLVSVYGIVKQNDGLIDVSSEPGRGTTFTICLGLKNLFMSGYTADVIAHHGVLDEGTVFIHKPFTSRDLAVKIRGSSRRASDAVNSPPARGALPRTSIRLRTTYR